MSRKAAPFPGIAAVSCAESTSNNAAGGQIAEMWILLAEGRSCPIARPVL